MYQYYFFHKQLLLKQIKSTPLGKEVESDFKKIDEGYEGDQGELSFKKSKKRSKAETDDLDVDNDDDDKMIRVLFYFSFLICS